MLIYILFNFYSLFKMHSYVLFFIFIYKNVVNICMINDLYYPPTTQPHIIGMQFFLLLDPWTRHSRITSTHAPYWFRHCCTRFTQTLFAVVCSPCGLRMRCRSSMDSFWFHTGRACSLLITGCLQQTQHLSIIWIQIQTLLLKMLFQHCDLLLSKYSKSIFYRRV